MRVCTKCGQEKQITEFHKKKGAADGIGRQCKVCHSSYLKKSKKKNPDAHADRWLRYKYGLTIEDFRKMEEEQGGSCAICGTRPNYRLCVDHRHDTGRIRGLLCRTCNKAIGQLGDTPESVLKAYKYLKKTH